MSAQSDQTEVDVTEPRVSAGTYELEFGSSLRAIQGSFDPYGNYSPYPNGTTAWSEVSTFGGAYRFSELFEMAMTLPFRHSVLSFPTGTITSNSIGGPLFVAKLHVGGWPHLVVHAGVSTPWRYKSSSVVGNPSASLPDDFDDSFPSGTSIPVGAGVSRSFDGFKFAFDLTYTYLLPQTQDLSDAPPGYPEVQVKSGARWGLSEGLAYELSHEWMINAGLRQMWLADSQVNGTEISNTAGRVFSTSLGISYSLDKIWRYTLRGDTLFPFYAYADNETYGPGISLQISFLGSPD
jgi:hypothetical protein